MQKYLLILLIFATKINLAQFAPAVGEAGTTAIYKDSSIFVSWANSCIVNRGFLNIEDTNYTLLNGNDTTNKTFFGSDTLAIGKPDGNMNVVSLGDGGSAILKFANPIKNGQGFDFAVFENGFEASLNNYFLELAFVEVSSDGSNFVRFPSQSLTQDTTQINSFGYLNPEKIHNLAGKYINDYGTPFDLDDIKDSLNINIDSIIYIKIIDVIGDINSNFCSYDAYGNKINDPFPTAFSSGGFDLNGVGVINQNSTKINNKNKDFYINVFPNPFVDNFNIKTNSKITNIKIYQSNGKQIANNNYLVRDIKINTKVFTKGIYFLKITTDKTSITKKIIKL